jgi:methionyl-tRNA formyltransferase
MHPGPLPQYAGLNAVSWALYHGETSHAVTIHRIVPKVDAGPIAYQSWFDVTERDTALTVSVKCVKAGVPLLLELVKTAAADAAAIPAINQDLSRRRYFGTEIPAGGRLVWTRPARDVANFVRACDYQPFHSPWDHPRTCLEGQEVAILKATRLDEPAPVPPGTVGEPVQQAIRVAARDAWVLVYRVRCEGQLRDGVDQLRPGQRFDGREGM